MLRSTGLLLRSGLFLCVCMCVCVSGGVLVHSLPWRVPCPERCACQIKPWFSPVSLYHEAPTVDCSHLLLTQLPWALPNDTHTLRLQSNLLSALDLSALRTLPNLTDLDLSQNHLGSVRGLLTQSSHHHSPLRSLLSLHLDENQLAHLPRASFSSLPALQELFLSHNRLSSLVPGAFSGLDALLRLHLNNNRLTSIDPRWFRALPQLEVLMLGGNPVETLPERGFRALGGSLRSLVLGEMGLMALPEKALEGLDNLESLSFYNNLLTAVPTQALRRVTGLKFLDLNKNRISLVQTGDFRDMVHLKELGLNNMEDLVSIERAALENLPELTKLEITNNPRLSFIHPGAFVQLGRLESLMLNSNALSALHLHTLLALPRLQEVSLHSNPLRCDCLFRWAAQGSGASQPRVTVRFIQPQATLCSEPPELRARKVRELSSGEMSASCLPVIPPGALPSRVGVRKGGHLALHCRALAQPQPRLYWVTPTGLRLGPAVSPLSGHTSNHTAPESHPRAGLQTGSPHRYNCTHSLSHAPLSGPSHYRLLPEGTLEIMAATLEEEGLYTCVAENELGADTRSVNVVVHGRKRRRAGLSHPRGFPLVRLGGVQVREVGRGSAVLSLVTGRNLPSARLSWHTTDTHTRTTTTRILSGMPSFNLTQLQPGTLYRVCLTGTEEEEEGPRPKPRQRGRPLCVTLRTEEEAVESRAERGELSLRPELTSAALLLLTLTLLLLALQACHPHRETTWDSLVMKSHHPHGALLLEVKGQEEFSSCKQPGRGERGSTQPVCC